MNIPENTMSNRFQLAEDVVDGLDLKDLMDLAISHLITFTYVNQKVFEKEWKNYYEA